MTTLDTRSPSRWLIATWCAIVAVLTMAALTAYVTYRWNESRQQLARSTELVAQTHALQADLLDMETGQRGYLVTREDDYLTPFVRAKERLDRDIEQVRASAAASAEQATRAAALARLAKKKVTELDSTLLLSRSGREADALALVRTNHGKATMDTAREVATQLQRHESALNERWIESEREWGMWLWIVLSVGTAFAVGVLLVLRSSLLTYAREQRQAMHELNRQMIAIEEQERIAQTQSGRGGRGAEPK